MAKKARRAVASRSAKSAAYHVRRGAEAIRSRDALAPGIVPNCPHQVERRALLEWAITRSLVLKSDFLDSFNYKGSGAEHLVYHDAENRLAIKVTHPNSFGHSVYAEGFVATPLEYLDRLSWCNLFLGDNFRVYGIIHNEEQVQVITAQPWIAANQCPHPSPQEIRDFFEQLGFLQASDDENAPFFYNLEFDLAIGDAQDHNVILGENGKLYAIDVVIGKPGPKLKVQILEVLARRSG